MTLAADVNPDTTGIDMNSTKNPKRKMPSNIVMHPDRKQSKAAYSGIPLKKNHQTWNVSALLYYTALTQTTFSQETRLMKSAFNNSITLLLK